IPIFKTDAAGHNFLVGGIGVFFPGATGFATEENSSMDATYNPSKRDRSLEAEFMAFAAVGGAPGIGFGVGTLDGVPRLPEIIFPVTPSSRIDLVGITLDIVGPRGAQGAPFLAAFGATLGQGNANDGLNYPVVLGGVPVSPAPMNEAINTIPRQAVPAVWLVITHDCAVLPDSVVVQLVRQG